MKSSMVRLLGVTASLAAAVSWLLTTGTGPDSPPLRSWTAFERWYGSVSPAIAALALVRFVALVLASWLLAGAVLQILARVSGSAALRLIADLISPRSLQRLGHGLAGLSLTAGLSLPAPSVGTPPPSPPVTEVQGPGTASLRPVEVESLESSPESGGTSPGRATPAPNRAPVVRVAPGESFWSIAEATVGGDDIAIARYWRALVEVNRARLVDPSNPDLIYPGQELVLPGPGG